MLSFKMMENGGRSVCVSWRIENLQPPGAVIVTNCHTHSHCEDAAEQQQH